MVFNKKVFVYNIAAHLFMKNKKSRGGNKKMKRISEELLFDEKELIKNKSTPFISELTYSIFQFFSLVRDNLDTA